MDDKRNKLLNRLWIGVLVALPIASGMAFTLGLFVGSAITTTPDGEEINLGSTIKTTTDGGEINIASQQQFDMSVPDPEFCRQWGASAFVVDVQVYTTLSPSTSFVTKPILQPGCVIRRENWSVLQKQEVISDEDLRKCEQGMNTFAYIGSIRDRPIVKCVSQTDLKDNKFINKDFVDDINRSPNIKKETIQL